MKNVMRKTTVSFFIINSAFWIGIFIYYTFFRFINNPEYMIIKILLLFEPVVFLTALWGYWKNSRVIYLVTLLFLLLNSVLSLTDEVGALDLVSFFLSLVLFIIMFIQRRDFFEKDSDAADQ